MLASIKRYGAGACVWCTKRGDGVDAEFVDGLKGFLCKGCLIRALKVRSGTAEQKGQKAEPPPAAQQVK